MQSMYATVPTTGSPTRLAQYTAPVSGTFSALQALVVAFTFLFGLGGRSQYFYAIMLTIMSLNALALCQVTNFHCLFCDEEGSPHYYAARVLSICLGCLAPMLVCALIPAIPWVAARIAVSTIQRMTCLLRISNADCCELHMEPCYAVQRLKGGLCLHRLPILSYPGAPQPFYHAR